MTPVQEHSHIFLLIFDPRLVGGVFLIRALLLFYRRRLNPLRKGTLMLRAVMSIIFAGAFCGFFIIDDVDTVRELLRSMTFFLGLTEVLSEYTAIRALTRDIGKKVTGLWKTF